MKDDHLALLLAQRELTRRTGNLAAPILLSRAHDATEKLARVLCHLTDEAATQPHVKALVETFPADSLDDITLRDLTAYTLAVSATLRTALEMLRDKLVANATNDDDDDPRDRD